MTDNDDTVSTRTSRRRGLEDERARLRAEVDILRGSSPNAEPVSEAGTELFVLDRRIRAIDDELESIALAEEIERQQDA